MEPPVEHPTLTDEQIALIGSHTERAAAKALRRYVRGSVVGFLILVAGLGYSLHESNADSARASRNLQHEALSSRTAIVQSGRIVAVDGCNRDFATITRLRLVLMRSRDIVRRNVEDGTYTQHQGAVAEKFYARQIRELSLPDCRQAKSIITDDPRRLGIPPTPRFPGDKKDLKADRPDG
jgi:hypothetical protein